jgi:hypothetical protein
MARFSIYRVQEKDNMGVFFFYFLDGSKMIIHRKDSMITALARQDLHSQLFVSDQDADSKKNTSDRLVQSYLDAADFPKIIRHSDKSFSGEK